MKIMKITLVAGLVLAASLVHSDTFTWDGGGADDNWNTAGNWDPDGVPDSDGTAVLNFSGNTRNGPVNDLAADTAFAGINFINDSSAGKTADFSLSGARLQLDGNVTATLPTVDDTIIDTIALDMVLSGTRTLTANRDGSKYHHLKVTGDISETGGTQGLTKAGWGNLYLEGDNTYSGKTIISAGELYFYSLENIGGGASALGAPTDITNGTIELYSYLRYQGAETTSDRPIHLTGNAQLKNYGSGTLTLTGDITGSSRSLFVRGSKNITLNGLVAISSIGRTDTGVLTLNCPTNSFGGTVGISDGYIAVETISDGGVISALGKGTYITFGQTGWDTTGKLRFSGASGGSCNRNMQVRTKYGTHGGLIENTVAGQRLTMSGNMNANIGISGIAPLWLTGAGDGEMSGVLSGSLAVKKTGTGTWILSGDNVYTGATTVSTGTLLVNGSTAADSAISVATSGTLGGTGVVHGVINAVSAGTLAPGVDGVGTLTLDNGSAADLTLNGNTIEADLSNVVGVSDLIAISGTMVVNGANTIEIDFPDGPAPFGTYTIMTYDAKSGTGTMAVDAAHSNVLVSVGSTNVTLTIVNTGSATWQGDGAANAWDTTTANWTSGVYVENDTVLFDDTGLATPDINITPAAVEPFSVTVDSDTNDYTIGGAAIAGTAGLTKSGDSVLTLTGDNTYGGLTTVNAGTLALNGGSLSNSSVNVAIDAIFTEDADSVIAGTGISFTTLGSAILEGSNTYDGVTTVGVVGTPNITLTLRNNQALGSTLNGVTLYGGSSSTESRVRIDTDGVVIKDETLTFAGGGTRAALQYNRANGTGTWDGNIVLGGAYCYLNANYYGGTLVIGGSSDDTITGSGGNLSLRGSGNIILNSTLNIGSVLLQRDDAGTCLINSTNNIFGNLNVLQGSFKLGVANALPSTTELAIGKSGNTAHAKFDLNGNSQTLASIADNHNTSAGGGGTQKILSSTPATLIVSNVTSKTFGKAGSAIEGLVTLVKSGAGTLTLTSTNTTSGSFIVSNGTLVVSSTGSFGENSTNVVVSAGTLTLQSSVAVADTATMNIADGATLNLDAGVDESVAYLFIDDVPKRANTYGATGSGAAVIDDAHFSGSGILTVLSDTSGTLMILQ